MRATGTGKMKRGGEKLTRKEIRKKGRVEKRIRKHEYFSGTTVERADPVKEAKLANQKEKNKRKRRRHKANKRNATRVQEEEVEELKEANTKEDILIRQLEKNLGMKKKGKVRIPKSFEMDGLDDLLDCTDEDKMKGLYEAAKELGQLGEDGPSDSDVGSEEDENISEDEELDGGSGGEMEVEHEEEEEDDEEDEEYGMDTIAEESEEEPEDDDDDDEDEGESKGELDDDDEDDDEGDDGRSDEAEQENGAEEEESSTTELKEDIYGRLRDKQGNVVQAGKTGAYVPPAKRLAQALGDSEKRKVLKQRLGRQLKGLFNRVSESNLQPIANQVEQVYRGNSRADSNEVLSDVILAACVAPSLIPERLITEHALLVALLHCNLGSEVGAHFIQVLAEKFQAHLLEDSPGKELNNIVVLFCALYNFKVIHSSLIYDLLGRFIKNFEEKDIELILLILKGVGFTLRKDDPAALKNLVVSLQEKAAKVDTSQLEDQFRVKFMLEILMAIKNNNMRKIPSYDHSRTEHCLKLLRNYASGSSLGEHQLNISLEDLLKADQLGRWWIVGSAWSGKDGSTALEGDDEAPAVSSSSFSSDLLELARKQRMNTDTRRNVFCVIMSSVDYTEALQRLLALTLKGEQQRELVRVPLHCCLREKTFNPYYAYLLQALAKQHRTFFTTMQYALWDHFRGLENLSARGRTNLGHLLCMLIVNDALSLTVLKVIQFSELSDLLMGVLKTLFSQLLLRQTEEVIRECFSKLAVSPKFRTLRETLCLLLKTLLLRDKKLLKAEGGGRLLKQRIEIAEEVLLAPTVENAL